MERRAYLAGAFAALAGCSGLDPTGSGGPGTPVVSGTTDRPAADDVLEETYPVEGTMVNHGVGGAARNAASTALVDCVVEASGTVGGDRHTARATRDRLAPGATWEWKVAFGDDTHASTDDSVSDIAVATRAEYVS